MGGFVGAILRPWYQDRLDQGRERRADKRDAAAERGRRLDEVRDLLSKADAGYPIDQKARRALPAAAYAIDDQELRDLCDKVAAAGPDFEPSLVAARRRVGELIRDL